MILSHEDGLNLINNLKHKYNYEIELLCLNSDFMNIHEIHKELIKLEQLQKDFPENIVLKESEFHSLDKPYYECSVFCDKKESDKFELVLSDRDITIDLYHDYTLV